MEYRISDKLAALKPSAIREIFKSLSDPSIISFAAGNPSPLSFPVEDLAALSADIFAHQSTAALQYSVTEGYPPFREAIKARMKEKFGIGRDFDETIVTTGGNQAVELCCKVMCNEGDVVVCENPSFIGALNAFRSNGAKTVGVPLRDDGIDTDMLDNLLASTPRAKMLYLIPTFQNPAGVTSTLENRKKVYEIAKKYLPNGGCGVVSFELKGGRNAAMSFMKKLKLCAIETHVADARTCCLNPATSTHRQMTDEQLEAAGIPAGLVRMSCGLEDKADLIADLAQALED